MGTLEEFIALYGPAVVFAGTLLEGETIVVVAGFLAHQGIVNPFAVTAAAFLGSFLGDQFCFFLGRRHASHPYVARLAQRPVFRKILSAIEDHPKKFILTFRFIYGIRTISPVAIGLSAIPARQFLVLNALSAAVWAAAFTVLGYVFGHAVESVIGDLKAIEHKIFAVAGIALAVFAAYQIGLRLRRRSVAKRVAVAEAEDKEAP